MVFEMADAPRILPGSYISIFKFLSSLESIRMLEVFDMVMYGRGGQTKRNPPTNPPTHSQNSALYI